MVVPSTPLHTTRVLTEDKAMWEDVKVRTTPAPTLTGQTFTALQRYKSLWHMIKYKDCSLEVSIINFKTVFPECCSGRSFKHSSVGLLCFQTRTVTVQGNVTVMSSGLQGSSDNTNMLLFSWTLASGFAFTSTRRKKVKGVQERVQIQSFQSSAVLKS